MKTRSQHANSVFKPSFLYALHSGTSVLEVQTTCATFANELIPAEAYGGTNSDATLSSPPSSAHAASAIASSRFTRAREHSRDPIFAKVATRLATVSSDHHLNACERRSFKFQSEISSGRISRAIQAPLAVAGALLGSINIARGPDAPVFRRDDAARLDLIARHASIALARAQREQELDRRCTIFEASLDVLDLPFVLTAPDRTIIFANRAARAGSSLQAGLVTASVKPRTCLRPDNAGWQP